MTIHIKVYMIKRCNIFFSQVFTGSHVAFNSTELLSYWTYQLRYRTLPCRNEGLFLFAHVHSCCASEKQSPSSGSNYMLFCFFFNRMRYSLNTSTVLMKNKPFCFTIFNLFFFSAIKFWATVTLLILILYLNTQNSSCELEKQHSTVCHAL